MAGMSKTSRLQEFTEAIIVRPSGVVLLCFTLLACPKGTEPAEPALRRIEIGLTPAVSTLMVNDTTRARLSGYDGSGAPYPAGPVIWHSTNPAVAQIDGDGLVQGRGPGSATIVAIDR